MRGLSSTMNNVSLTVMVMKNEPGILKDKINISVQDPAG